VAGLADLEPRQLLARRVHGGGEAAQQPGAVGGGESGPPALGAVGAADGGGDAVRGGRGDGGDDLLGGRVDHLVLRRVLTVLVAHGAPHRRSKERNRSQSVTAVS
jgi:hypothetical protein